MRNRKKHLRVLSTSDIYTKRLKNRAALNGAVTVDRSVAIDRIRNSSIGLNQNILKPTESNCSFVYNPSSYGEGKNYVVYPQLGSGLNNVSKYSEEFDNSYWVKNASIVDANQIANPIDGLVTADVLRQNGIGDTGSRRISATVSLNGTYTLSVYVKKKDFDGIGLNIIGDTNAQCTINITTGVTITNFGSAVATVSTQSLAGGWYRCIMTSNITNIVRADILLTDATGNFVFNNTNTFGNYIYGAQLEQGSTATTYQRTTDGITDFQFTRATTATVTNKDGSIGDSCYNLVTNTDPNSATGAGNNNNLTYVTGFAWNYGSLSNATILTNTSSNANRYFNFASIIGTMYRISCYVIMDDLSKPVIGTSTSTGDFSFILGATIISDSSTFQYENVSGNVWRVSAAAVAALSNNSNGIIKYTGQSSKLFKVTGYQMAVVSSLTLAPRDYLKTINRLAVPRADYTLDLTKHSFLIEPQRTNIVFPSATGSTQTRTVTSQVYTMSFRGTGSVTLSGVATGTLNGTGANNKVSLTFTPTAGSLTFTVTGTITDFQVEAGNNATSIIPTISATVTRNGETSYVDLWNNSLLNQNNFTLFVDGYLYDGSGATRSIALADTTTGGANDVGFFDGIKASFAASSVITSDTTSLSSNTAFKLAIQRSGTSIKFFRNGAQIWSTQTVAIVDYRYLIINNGGSTFAINKIELFKETLSDATLVTKTT